MDIIGKYVRKAVQQLENVRMGGCIRVLDRLGNRFAIDYAISGEINQAFNLGPVLPGGFHNSSGIHIRVVKETSITRVKNMESRGYIRGSKFCKENWCSRRAIGTIKEICAEDMGCASFINQVFATSRHNVRFKAVDEGHAQNKGHTSVRTTKAIRADNEPICTVLRANISHLLTETSASPTFSACLLGWSSSPRNFASSSEMKFSDAPVSASACAQCSLIRVLKKKQSRRCFGRVTFTGGTQLSTGHTDSKYALITCAAFTQWYGRDTDRRFLRCKSAPRNFGST